MSLFQLKKKAKFAPKLSESKPVNQPTVVSNDTTPKTTKLAFNDDKVNELTKSVIYGAPNMTTDNSHDDGLLNSIYEHIAATLIKANQYTPLVNQTMVQYQKSIPAYQVYEYLQRIASNHKKHNPFTTKAINQNYSKLSATDDTIDQQLDTIKTKWLPQLVEYAKQHCPKALAQLVADQLEANYKGLIDDWKNEDLVDDYLNYQLLDTLKDNLLITDGIHQFESDIIHQAAQIKSLAELMRYLNWNFQLMNLHRHWYYRPESPYYYSVMYSLVKDFVKRWTDQYGTNDTIDDIQDALTMFNDKQIVDRYQNYVVDLSSAWYYHNNDSVELKYIK